MGAVTFTIDIETRRTPMHWFWLKTAELGVRLRWPGLVRRAAEAFVNCWQININGQGWQQLREHYDIEVSVEVND